MMGDLNSKPAENDSRFRVFWPIADERRRCRRVQDHAPACRGNDSKQVNIKPTPNQHDPDTEHYYNYIGASD